MPTQDWLKRAFGYDSGDILADAPDDAPSERPPVGGPSSEAT
jgi:hypothetical protein